MMEQRDIERGLEILACNCRPDGPDVHIAHARSARIIMRHIPAAMAARARSLLLEIADWERSDGEILAEPDHVKRIMGVLRVIEAQLLAMNPDVSIYIWYDRLETEL